MNEVVSLIGIPDDNRARVAMNRGRATDIEISIPGTTSINDMIDKKAVPFRTVALGGSESIDIDLGRPSLVINTICEADANQKALTQAADLIDKLGENVAVLNHPHNILRTTRNSVYELLREVEGIRVPKTLRVAPRYLRDVEELIDNGALAAPFIFRQAGLHNGLQTYLLEGLEQMPELEQFAFDGRDYYITEFADYRSSDGLYRKSRLFVIDGAAYPRHQVVSRQWNIHAGSRNELMHDNPGLQDEENRFLNSPDSLILQRCKSIYDILQLDFFGIDCHITDDNELLIFEINACMKSLYSKNHPHLNSVQSLLCKATTRMVEKRLGNHTIEN